MSTAALDLIITLKDEASRGIGGVSKEVSALGKESERTHSIVSGLFTGIGFAAFNVGLTAVSSGFHALTGFIGDSIQESRDAAAGLAQTEAVIKSTGGAAGVTAQQIVDMAGALSHSTLFTDDAIQAGENMTLTFTNIGKEVFPQVTSTVLDMATALHSTPEAMAQMTGKALSSADGVSALRRVGVQFTDQQVAMVKQLFATGDAVGAQRIVLGELAKEFGGSAEAAAQADGGFHLFQQRLADVEQTIGDALQPALASLMGFMAGPGLDAVEALGGGIAHWLSDTAVPALISFIGTLGDLGKYIGAVVSDGDTLNDWLSHLPGWLQPIAEIGGTVITTLQGIAGAVKDAITGLSTGDFSNLKIDLSGMFGDFDSTPITDALQGIREGWGLARDALVTFQQAVGDFGVTARTVFDWLSQTGIPQITDAFTASMPGNIQLVHDLTTALTGLQGQSSTTSTGIKTDLNALTDPFSGIALWINTIQQSFNWLGQQTHAILVLAGSDFGVFWGQIQSIGASIGGVLSTIGTSLSTFGANVAAIVKLAGADFQVFWSQVQTVGTTIGTVLSTLGTNFTTFGANVSATVKLAGADVALVWGNIIAKAGELATTIKGDATLVWSTFYNAVETANTKVVTAVQGIETAVSTMASTVGTKIGDAVTTIAGLPSKATAALGDLGSTLTAAGSKLVQGLIDGINSKFEAVKKVLGTLTSMLPSWKGPADVDAKLLYENGRIIIGGFVEGLRDAFPDVQTVLGDITGYIGGTVSQALANMTDLIPQLPQLAAGFAAVGASVRSTDDILSHVTFGGSGGGGGPFAYLNQSIRTMGDTTKYTDDIITVAGPRWGETWKVMGDATVAALDRADQFAFGASKNILGYVDHAIQRIDDLIAEIGKIPGIHVNTNAATPFSTGALIPRAMGGPVTAGKGYLVGERRPEAFFPTRSGIITPSIPQAGGGDVNLTIDLSGADFGGSVSRADVVGIVKHAVDQATDSLKDVMIRNGQSYGVL